VLVSQQTRDKLLAESATTNSDRALAELAEEKRLKRIGRFEMPDILGGATLYEMKLPGLEGRYFGRMSLQKGSQGDNDNSHSVHTLTS
jgi:hypothetical protein